MSQVALAFPYLLMVLNAPPPLTKFWANFSDLIQRAFNPALPVSERNILPTLYKEIISDAKVTFPKLVEKTDPNNIHSVLEMLLSDLEVFGNGWFFPLPFLSLSSHLSFFSSEVILIDAQIEEHRHSPLKNGLHFTNKREESVLTLIEMTNAIDFLRYLMKGGSYVDSSPKRVTLDQHLSLGFHSSSSSFLFFIQNSHCCFFPARNLLHPTGRKLVHPVLRAFCPDFALPGVQPEVSPKGFMYEGRRHVPKAETTFNESGQMHHSLREGEVIDTTWALKSRQVTVRGTTFQVGDDVAADAGIFQICAIITLRVIDAERRTEKTFFKGRLYRYTPERDYRLDRNVYVLDSEPGMWIPAESLKKLIFVHHRCSDACQIIRTCIHEQCPSSCPSASAILRHSSVQEFFVEPNFRILV